MSRPHGPGLLFQTQNMEIHNEGFAVKKTNNGISKNSQKKVAGGNRKALQDLSNSALLYQTQNLDIHKEGSLGKKTGDGLFRINQKKPLQNLSNSQNMEIHKEGSFGNKMSDSTSKTSQKKVGVGRKALQDLSNSLSLRQEAARKEKKLSREEFNVVEEGFLHNSKQRTTARKAEMDSYIHDAVLFEHGLLHPDTSPLLKEAEISFPSPRRPFELEPIPELPISAKTDWSPSPIQLDSPLPPTSLHKLPELEKSKPKGLGVEQTFQNPNSDIFHYGPDVGKKTGDISNSASLCHEEATKKNQHEEFQNFEGEGFLHDHKKCTAAQKAQMDQDIYNALLFEHGLLNPDASPETKETTVVESESPRWYLKLEEVPELLMPEVADWCSSPIGTDSPPFSPSRYELPELVLKPCYAD